MNDQEFREVVIQDLAEIKTEVKGFNKDINGFRRTLYGDDGCGGIVKTIHDNEHRQTTWNKLLTIFVGIAGALATFAGVLASWLKWSPK